MRPVFRPTNRARTRVVSSSGTTGFTPDDVRLVHEASLVFESNDPASPHEVAVRGEAFAAVLDVVPSPIDIGSAQVGCTVLHDVDVHNNGNEVLVVQPSLESASSAEFSIPSGSDPREIAPSTFETMSLRGSC